MTAAKKPGRREGGSSLDCCACDLVLMEGGATWAASVATWALVCTRGYVLIGVAAFHSLMACCFLRHSCLVESVGMLVGLLVDAPLLGTLRTGVCVSMERVILLFHRYGVWAHSGVAAPSELFACGGYRKVLRCLQSIQVVPECWIVWRQ